MMSPDLPSVAAVHRFIEEHFPESREGHGSLVIEAIDRLGVAVRLAYSPHNLRPGGTLSGPAMMNLADYASYVLVLSHCALEPLAVTANLSIHFLRKPEPCDLIALVYPLKIGRRLVIATVSIYTTANMIFSSDWLRAPPPPAHHVAEASITYAMPSKPSMP